MGRPSVLELHIGSTWNRWASSPLELSSSATTALAVFLSDRVISNSQAGH